MLRKLSLKALGQTRLLIAFSIMVSPTMLLADDHGKNAPSVTEIYPCNLINGATVDDVLKFGRGEFTEFAKDVGNDVGSYLWTPVSVAPPYQDISLRWVNHYPSWAEYDKGNAAWMSNNADKLRKKLFSMTSCELPIYQQSHAILRTKVERPARLLIGRCEFNEGKDINDVKRDLTPTRSKAVAEALGITRAQLVSTPRVGVDASIDFLHLLLASRTDMAKLQDAGRTNAIQTLYRQMGGGPPPHSCSVWDLHDSHYIYNSQ